MKQRVAFSSLGLFLALAMVTPAALQALTAGAPYVVVNKTAGSSHGLHSQSMIYADGVYAIAYMDTDSGYNRVMVAFIDGNNPGAPIGTYHVNSDIGGSQGNPRIAFNTSLGKFGVVWVRYDATGTASVLEYRWLKKTGEMSASPVVISSAFPARPDSPDIVYDSELDRFAIVFSYYQAGAALWDLRLMTIDYAGNVLFWTAAPVASLPASMMPRGASLPQFGGPDAFGPAIAADASGYGIVFTYGSNRPIHYVYARKAPLGVQTGPVQISAGNLNQIAHIVYNSTNSEFGATWQYFDGAASGAAYFARLGPSGLIDRKTLATSMNIHSVDLWWDGSRYILGWYEAPESGVWYLKAATCTSAGVLEATPIVVQALGGDQTHVAARGPDNYFIQWRLGYEDVWGATATNSNTLIASASPAEGGTVAKVPDLPVYGMGDPVTITATPATADWQFTGWSGDASGADNPKTITMDRAKNVVANFYNTAWPTLTLTVSPPGSGTTTPVTPVQKQPGQQVPLVATANSGYIFNSWKDGGQVLSTNRAYTYTMPSASVTLTAAFDVAYSVATSANPTNGGTVAPTGALWYVAGSVVAFTATPAANYSFAGWNVNGLSAGNANPINVTIDSNKTIYADFTYGGGGTTYTLSTNISPAGTGTVTPNYGVYAAGSVVKVTATPATGYSFDSWTGSASGSTNPTNVTMNANKSVTAVFKEGPADDAPTASGLAQKTSIKSSRATFSLNYSDPNGDLTGGYVRVSYKYKSTGKTYKQAVRIPAKLKSITGTTSGTIEWVHRFMSYSTRYKSFDMTVYLEDAAGGQGNSLTITVKKSYSKKPRADGGDWGE